jgi:hypothetical protein
MPIKRSAIAPAPVFSRARWSAAEKALKPIPKPRAKESQLSGKLVVLDLFNQDGRTPVRVFTLPHQARVHRIVEWARGLAGSRLWAQRLTGRQALVDVLIQIRPPRVKWVTISS